MSRKGAKPGAANNKKGVEEEREDSLQAVVGDKLPLRSRFGIFASLTSYKVVADSFERRFSPFTKERPRCLLPLANTPLIEYTLEFLAKAGVQEIFLYSGAHTDQVEEYLRASKWQSLSSPFRSLDIIKTTSRSVGDVMRDLDSRDIITGDFLVVSGDVVSNISLELALAKHRARRATDKNAIMTMVLRKAGRAHRTKAHEPSPVFVLDPTRDRCLHYEEMQSLQSGHYVNIDPELFSHPEIDVRSDLIDCYIDVCTPDVLALWTDSFDYESPRKHFLYGVLKDYELNGKTIHTHIVEEHYAARVRDLQAYDAVSKDIVSRWAYPICPDSNLLPGQSYRFLAGNVYLEEGVVLARSCLIKKRTVIGQNTSIGDGSTVGNSIIGRRCQIGRNVNIDGAYIWDDTVISDNSDVRRAIVANEAMVGPQCTIEPGALISYGVRLKKGTRVRGISQITRETDMFEASSDRYDGTVVPESPTTNDSVDDGEDGQVSIGSGADKDSVRGLVSSSLLYSLPDLAVSDTSISTLNSELGSDRPLHRQRSPRESFATMTSEDGHEDDFYHDAASSIFDALQRGDGPDIVQIELQSLRMGVDANYHQVRRAIIAAVSKHIQQLMERQSLGVGEAVGQVVKKYQVIFEKTIFDQKKEIKSDQVDLLLSLQKDLIHRNRGDSVLLFMAKSLYFLDVLEEDGLNQWWEEGRSSSDAEMLRVRAQTQQFIDWLANAEEDSENEDVEDD